MLTVRFPSIFSSIAMFTVCGSSLCWLYFVLFLPVILILNWKESSSLHVLASPEKMVWNYSWIIALDHNWSTLWLIPFFHMFKITL